MFFEICKKNKFTFFELFKISKTYFNFLKKLELRGPFGSLGLPRVGSWQRYSFFLSNIFWYGPYTCLSWKKTLLLPKTSEQEYNQNSISRKHMRHNISNIWLSYCLWIVIFWVQCKYQKNPKSWTHELDFLCKKYSENAEEK